jgi:hypothetical protein
MRHFPGRLPHRSIDLDGFGGPVADVIFWKREVIEEHRGVNGNATAEVTINDVEKPS